MKNHLLFLLTLLLGISFGLKAQTPTLTVADGTTTNQYVPFYGYWTDVDQHIQILYPASMLADMQEATIAQMVWYLSQPSPSPWGISATIKLTEITNGANLAQGLMSVPADAMTTVWQGIVSGASTTIDIQFDDYYLYLGGDLLVDITTVGNQYGTAYFYGVNSTGASYFSYTGSSSGGGAGNFIPKTTFTYSTTGSFCFAPQNISVSAVSNYAATITWNGDAVSYSYEWGETGFEEGDGITETVYEGVAALENLEPGTVYDIVISSTCDEGTSDAVRFTFSTPALAAEIPYYTGFESDQDIGWSFANGDNGWYIGGAVSNGGMQSMYISADGGATNGASFTTASMSYAYRPINFSVAGDYVIEFDWCNNGFFYFGTSATMLAALAPGSTNWTGTVANSDITSDSWMWLDNSLSQVSTWQHYTNTITITEPGVYYLTFIYYVMGYGANGPAGAIDNINIIGLTCPQPTNITTESVGPDFITIGWTAGGDESEWVVRANDGEWTLVDDNSHTFTDLSPSTTYLIEVAAYCGEGDTSVRATANIHTSCGAINEFPWVETFDNMQGEFVCWTHMGGGEVDHYITGHSGAGVIFYPNGSATPNTFIAPEMENLHELEATFYTTPEGSASGSLAVGYVVIEGEDTTFTALETYSVQSEWGSNFGFHEMTVSFSDAPSDARIAFRHIPESLSWYWYLDEVNVHPLPSCTRPYDLTLTSVTATTMDLAWSDTNEVTPIFQVDYRVHGTSAWIPVDEVDVTTITIENLTPSTTYDVRILSLCNDGEVSSPIVGEFRTTCVPLTELPYVNNFIEYDLYNLFSDPCWSVGNNFGSNYDPEVTTVYTDDSYSSYYVAIYAYTNENEYAYAAMPILDEEFDITNLELSFDQYGGYGGGYSRRVIVGLCGTQFDINNFDTIAIFDGIETTTIPRMLNFLGYTGENRRIVFVFSHDGVASSGNYAYVGNVNLHLLPSCIAPTSFTVTSATSTTISVAITGDATATYRYSITDTDAGSTPVSVDLQAMEYTFTGLLSQHGYVVSVATVCEDELSMEWTAEASTTVGGVDLPYTTGFEGSDNSGWQFANGANGWYIGSAIASTGDKALYISNNEGTSNAYSNTTCVSYAYKAFNVNSGINAISFDWRCNGENNYDYLRVFLAPANFTPEANNNNNIGTAGSPAGWIALDGGTKLNLKNTWQNKTTIFDVPSEGVFYLIFCWRNDASGGSNPPAAIDNIMLSAVTCHAPTELIYDNIGTTSATMSWNAGGEEENYHMVITNDDNVEVVNTSVSATTYTTPSTLLPATHYNVKLRSVCAVGDTSFALHGNFYTSCEHYDVPYYYGFEETSLNVCWSNPASTASTPWGSAAASQNNHQIYTYANGSATPSNDWLISPVIDIPVANTAADTSLLELVYYIAGWRNNSYTSSKSKYELRVSPTGNADTASFTDILTIEEMDTNVFQRRHFPMSQYAGQSIRFAFRSLNQYYAYLYLYEVGIRQTNMPLYYLGGDDHVFTNDTNTYYAIYEEGDVNNVTYSWTSTMAAAGQAVMTNADMDTMQIVYTAAGTDTLKLVVTNNFGHDTSVTIVNIMELNPVTVFPYSTGFEPSNLDNFSWITMNAANGWVIGTTAHNGGSQSLYISKDGGISNEYEITNSSLSYVYRAFEFTETGKYGISFDWRCNGESSYDFVRVWMVPEDLFNVDANVYPGNYFNTSSLSTGSVPGWLAVGGKLSQSSEWVSFIDSVDIQTPGRYYLTFLWANDGSIGNQPAAAIDNVVVDNSAPVIVCTPPVINSVVVGETTAKVNFTIPETEEDVEYTVQAVILTGSWDDDVADASTAVTLTYPIDTTYTFSNITAETEYTIGLRTICEGDNASEWATNAFTTESHPCIMPTNLSVGNITFDGATFTWTAGENETSWEVRVYNTTYDETLLVETSPTLIVTGLYAGLTYNVTVRAICSEENYSEWCDTLSFVPSICEPVNNVLVNNETNTSATVAWTAAEGQSHWEIDYGAQGHPQGTGTMIVVETNPYTLTGLNEYTPYDLYVRAVCEDGNKSEWSPKATFTTLDIKDAMGTAVSLYPNPATGSVTISGIGGEAVVTVVDMNGRTLYGENANGSLTIDLTGYSKGAYFVRISSEQILAIRKLIVK